MKVIFGSQLYVIIEKEDKKIPNNWRGDSLFLYQLKNLLNKEGFNMIKKRMWRDGHMVDDVTQYIRQATNAKKTDPHFYIYDHMSAMYCIKERFTGFTSMVIKDTDRCVNLAITTSIVNDTSFITIVKKLADKSDKIFYTENFNRKMLNI